MWGYRAVRALNYWSLTLHRLRRDGGQDRRYAVVPCGVWTPAHAHHALNSPSWHTSPDGATPAHWTAAQRAALRAGLTFIALGGRGV